MQRSFDIIVAGGGMAGLSLLWFLKRDGFKGSVCLIDTFDNDRINRTWSFWSENPGPFDHLSRVEWHKARVVSGSGEKLILDLSPYRYLSITGADFHQHLTEDLSSWSALTKVQAKVIACLHKEGVQQVETDSGMFFAAQVFDSTFRPEFNQAHSRSLLQHFLGYVIETNEDFFDPHCPDLMNFQVREQRDCHFVYVLPFSPRKALVEYTVFSESLLDQEEYDVRLREWLSQMGIHSFQIVETEKGSIPMSDAPVPAKIAPGLFRIGTSGGFTNPATGYTFFTTQQILQKWSQCLVKGDEIPISGPVWHGKYAWFYGTLLEVLKHRMLPAHEVFFRLYKKNPAPRILSFLNAESDFKSEFLIMCSTRITVFIRAGVRVWIDQIRRAFLRRSL